MPQQRLWQAVEALAASAEPIQRRLFWAGQYLAPLRPEDFADPEDREAFAGVMGALNARPAKGEEGTLEATTATLGDQEAVELAGRIVALDAACRPLT